MEFSFGGKRGREPSGSPAHHRIRKTAAARGSRHRCALTAVRSLGRWRHGAHIFRKHFERGTVAQAEQQAVHRRLGCLLAQLLLHVEERGKVVGAARSEEHTSELQLLMRISYAV